MREVHHNTDEQATDYLRRAWQAVEAAELPEHLHPIAFQHACQWLAAKTLVADAPVPLAAPIPRMDIPRGRHH